jgi:hypothetical protein
MGRLSLEQYALGEAFKVLPEIVALNIMFEEAFQMTKKSTFEEWHKKTFSLSVVPDCYSADSYCKGCYNEEIGVNTLQEDSSEKYIQEFEL